MTVKKPSVLFVCTHNSARSQMAHGLLEHLAGDHFRVYSAGVEPGRLNPLSVEALALMGIDISGHVAEGIDVYLGRVAIDTVVIVCERASTSCPQVWPGAAERLHWFFDDPSATQGTHAEKLAAFCRVRDEIRARIEQWLTERGVPVKAGGA